MIYRIDRIGSWSFELELESGVGMWNLPFSSTNMLNVASAIKIKSGGNYSPSLVAKDLLRFSNILIFQSRCGHFTIFS